MLRAKTLLVAVFVVVAFAAAAALLWPRWSTRVPAPSAAAAGLSLFGYAEDGALSWHITAESGTLADEGGTLSDVELMLSEQSTSPITVRADELTRTSARSILAGSVVVEREDGLRVTTDRMTWDEANRTLVASETALEYAELRASGLRSSYDLSKTCVTIEDQVRVAAMGDDGWSLSSGRLDVCDGTLTATGSVVVETKDGERYTCDTLAFNEEREDLSMTGEVQMAFSSGRIEADRATITSAGFTAASRVTLYLDLGEVGGEDG